MQQFAVTVKPNPEDGGFIATVPGHPHIVARGETEEAALEDARIALESTAEGGDAETTNGEEDPESSPHPFDSRPALEALASEQGVVPADDFDALLGDFWPEEEGADEFAAGMKRHLRNFVVYPFDRSLCLQWAEAADSARRNGRPIEVADAWIAATALEHGLPLVTNNAAHYAGVEGLTIVAETTRQEE